MFLTKNKIFQLLAILTKKLVNNEFVFLKKLLRIKLSVIFIVSALTISQFVGQRGLQEILLTQFNCRIVGNRLQNVIEPSIKKTKGILLLFPCHSHPCHATLNYPHLLVLQPTHPISGNLFQAVHVSYYTYVESIFWKR